MSNEAVKLKRGGFATGSSDKIKCRPFLKWVGGKTQLLSSLTEKIPAKFEKYFEPFVGGGALFFSLQPKNAILSDLNPELVNLYKVIRDDVEALIGDLKKHRYNEEYFYRLRNVDRGVLYKKWSSVKRASRLIYLNKTCFNGLYRVNKKGEFNVPFGRYTNPTILDSENLIACSAALQNADLKVRGFEAIADDISSKDFVYYDPPYVPLSASSSFANYYKTGFDLEMQKALYDLCVRLDRRGVRFMLSNSSAPFVLDLYKKFEIKLVAASRAINSKASGRGKVNEVLVTNY